MRFIPVHLSLAQGAAGSTNQRHTFHFAPVARSIHAVEVAPGMDTAPSGESFYGVNLSNNLKVHYVAVSPGGRAVLAPLQGIHEVHRHGHGRSGNRRSLPTGLHAPGD